jgi:hypothetical protein
MPFIEFIAGNLGVRGADQTLGLRAARGASFSVALMETQNAGATLG